MLVDKIRKFYNKDYDLNCAECILYAANEEYNLNLSIETLKSVAGFGGGIAIEDTCGAAIGVVSVVGIIFTEISGHKSPIVRELTREFMVKFSESLESNKCDELKKLYRKDEESRCILIIEKAGSILDEIIKREKGEENGI